MTNRMQKYLPLIMWLFPVLFFTYQFILRLWPGLMMDQIMQQFNIDAKGFGFLAALYYYGYSGMQIPAAILLEKYKARYIIFIFALICGIATFIFTYTTNWYLACLSRFLIGAGSAIGFLGTSKVISEWFPQNQYAKMVGLSFSVGLMGAVYGGRPLAVLIENYDWKKIAVILSLLSISIGLSAYLFLRSNKKNSASIKTDFSLENFKKLLSSSTIWLVALANLLMVGCLEGFSDIWGVQYLMSAHNIVKKEAAELISFIFIGVLFGGPLLAYLSKVFGNFTVIALCGYGTAIAFFLLFSIESYNWYLVALLLFLLGIMCCYQIIIFAAGSELVSLSLLGVTVAFLNCNNMLGGSFFHTFIGYAMDYFSKNTAVSVSDAYVFVLSVIPICSFLGALIITVVNFRKRNLLI